MHLPTCVATLMLSFALLFGYHSDVEGARILAVYSFPGKSHFMMHSVLIKELIERGHQVTMVTAMSLKKLKLGQNYTEILIEPIYDYWNDVIPILNADSIFELSTMGLTDFYKILETIGVKTTEHALKQPKVKQLINDPNPRGKYDLLLCEQFYQETFLALSYIYDIPVITSSTLGFENHMSNMMGSITPWAFVPHAFMPLTDHMTFMERVKNVYCSILWEILREFQYIPKMDQLREQHFGHLKVAIPPVAQMEKNVSLILLNSYSPLMTARPLMPNMIQVGGMHITATKKLPQDIQRFVDEAEHGVIYFSLGSNVQSKDMPQDKLNTFLEVFASLKQRIIWKFENESITNLPKNVLIKSWLPQSDILAHRNVKVFITHGGLFGTQEGIYHAIPMLGIPIYCDQHLNIKKAEINGYAISLDFQSINRKNLKESLNKLLYDPYYRDNINRISTIFRDRPVSARETAMYWIEYVTRYGGAQHIRSAGVDLKWYQFYLLDVVGFVVVLPLLLVAILIYMVRSVFPSGEKSKNKKKSKSN